MQSSTHRDTLSTPISRLNALREKHQTYKKEIRKAQQSPSTTDYYLSQLKKQKLVIKEEIEGIRNIQRAS